MRIAVLLLCTQLFAAQAGKTSGDDAAVRDMVKRYADARDLSDPKAAIWEGILDDLRQADEPVYLETDPDTNIIRQAVTADQLDFLRPDGARLRFKISHHGLVGHLVALRIEVGQGRLLVSGGIGGGFPRSESSGFGRRRAGSTYANAAFQRTPARML